MEKSLCRIAVFYDGTYFYKVSNFYLHQHQRKSRINIKGLHEFIVAKVADVVKMERRHCQIVDAVYFRGRLNAKQALESDKLMKERLFEDSLIAAEVSLMTPPLVQKVDGTFEEKGVDVLMALEVLEHTYLKRYEICVLVTGDGDYVPLVRKLNTLGSQVMLLGWDFEFEREGSKHTTRVSNALIEKVNFPVLMNDEIDSRERRDDPLINKLFSTVPIAPIVREPVLSDLEIGNAKLGLVVNLVTEKGYGFIKPTAGGENVYFHASDTLGAPFEKFSIGTKVKFYLKRTEKGFSAYNVVLDTAEVLLAG